MDYWGAKYYPPGNKAYGYLEHLKICSFVCKHNQHPNARGSGGMLPQKILCSEIDILESKYMHVI